MSTEQEFQCGLQLIKSPLDLDARVWTQMAKDCTSGVTTTGALKSKETANFLNGVFEFESAETLTMDMVFGYEHDRFFLS